MTANQKWDRLWTYALVRNCDPGHVNDIVTEVGPAASDSIEVRNGEWFKAIAKTLSTHMVGKVFLHVLELRHSHAELCPEAVEMLKAKHGVDAVTA